MTGSHSLRSEHWKSTEMWGKKKKKRLYIKLEKKAMDILEFLWIFAFAHRGLQPKWFLAMAESNKSLHGWFFLTVKRGVYAMSMHSPDGVFHPSCSFGCGHIFPITFVVGHTCQSAISPLLGSKWAMEKEISVSDEAIAGRDQSHSTGLSHTHK